MAAFMYVKCTFVCIVMGNADIQRKTAIDKFLSLALDNIIK